ncbi:hypothetical protein COLO4_33436 [Corchorus olitorius]|uniref:Uncharacterized protein n=1 Tax=Corchorus olitorius TaxID=93759 RepID=A0A1R3GTM8_9ROSI|nr:hypothetical protein COLO4_33436 [Corchorus olitorius]
MARYSECNISFVSQKKDLSTPEMTGLRLKPHSKRVSYSKPEIKPLYVAICPTKEEELSAVAPWVNFGGGRGGAEEEEPKLEVLKPLAF